MASGQELNTEHAQNRTLFGPTEEQILADCQAEIKKHEFQANYDRRSIQKLSETIASQQEELHRAQAEELHRREQQLLHAQLLQQNWDPCEAHEKSLDEMEELKRFQGSTFDTIARRRLVEDQDTILELTGKIQELQNETCVFPTSSNSWWNTEPFKRNAEPQRRAAKHLGHAWCIGKRFCKSSCVLFSTLSAGIESMEFRKRRTDSLINGGEE